MLLKAVDDYQQLAQWAPAESSFECCCSGTAYIMIRMCKLQELAKKRVSLSSLARKARLGLACHPLTLQGTFMG